MFSLLIGCSSLNKMSADECEQNRKVNYLVLPIKGDKYGVEDNIKSCLKDSCFSIIPIYKVLEIIDKNNINMNSMSDYEVFKIGIEINADYIIWGDAYTNEIAYEEPDTDSKDNSFSKAFKKSFAQGISGTWVYVTLFKYDIKNGEKNIYLKNEKLFKIE
jgi:hypothetical protein